MNINATAASRIVWVMDNNWAEQFPEDCSIAKKAAIDQIMEWIIQAALKCDNNLMINWDNGLSSDLRQEVKDYLTEKMMYNIEEHFVGDINDGFVIKW